MKHKRIAIGICIFLELFLIALLFLFFHTNMFRKSLEDSAKSVDISDVDAYR